ncbi:hypothetical protein ACFTXM_33095 [Streptomyces sp. NPDC056930]|uniref:hypothetical protein n=1 Tax=Streptomyces sp. NPDC056930 TaxID=3345967 RepID=UPI003633718B
MRHGPALEATRRPELRAVLKAAARPCDDRSVDLLPAAGVPEPKQRENTHRLPRRLIPELANPGGLDLDPAELHTTLLHLMRTN